MSERVGVYGGTFNPIHRGHLHAARQVRERLGLSRVLLVPAADPPLKQDHPDPLAPAQERLAWVAQAVADDPHLEADGLELEREGPSYSVDTLRILGERLAPARPVFVIGCDAFRELASWRLPRVLLTLCDFAVMARPPGHGDLRDWIPESFGDVLAIEPTGQVARHRSAGTRIERVEVGALDISATEVRRRIRAGQPVADLLPESVHDAVLASSVYSS